MTIAIRINKSVTRWVEAIEQKVNFNPFTPVYGTARSLLALGTLLTIALNPTSYLFISTNFQDIHHDVLKNINLFYLFGYSKIWLSKTIALVILTWVISGYYPQISGVLHWWVSYSFFNAAVIVDGGDQLTQILALLLVPITLLDKRRNHWSAPVPSSTYRNYLGILFIFFIRLQIAVLYFNAGVAKFNVPEWLNGTAMYYWLTHNTFGAPNYIRHAVLALIDSPIMVLLITWSVILLEILLSMACLLPVRRRMIFLKLGIFFHFLTFVFLGLGSFFLAMCGALIIYLYPLRKNH